MTVTLPQLASWEMPSVRVTVHRYNDVEHEMDPALGRGASRRPGAPGQACGTLEERRRSDVYRELLAAFLAHLSVQAAELDSGRRDAGMSPRPNMSPTRSRARPPASEQPGSTSSPDELLGISEAQDQDHDQDHDLRVAGQ